MLKRILHNDWVIGIACGLLGILLTFYGVYVPATDSFADMRDVPPIVVALFVSPLAGVVAGAVAMVGRALMPFFGMGANMWFALSLGTFLSALVAVGANRFIFFGLKPSFSSAALTAAIAELANMACALVFGMRDIDNAVQILGAAFVIQCMGAAIITGVASLFFNARQRLKDNLVGAVLSAVLTGIIFAVWYSQNRLALSLAAETMSSVEDDAVVAVDYPIEPELLRNAHLNVNRYKAASNLTSKAACELAERLKYDFVGVIDGKGEVIASSDGKAVGFNINSDEDLKEFMEVGKNGHRYLAQPFRSITDFPISCIGHACKFVALMFPEGGGMLMLAESFGNFAARDYLFEGAMQDWHVGKTGSLLLIDPASKTVVSGIKREYTGMTMEEVGFDTLKPVPVGNMMSGNIFGKHSLIRRKSLEFAPLDVCVIIPYGDVMYQRDLSAVMTAIFVAFVFALGAAFVGKITKQARDIDELRAREDEKRQKDMELAKSIQTSSLVTDFHDGIFAKMRTAREVGGDFYDCFALGDNKLMLVIADVSGKGIPAALFMMRARTEIRAVSRSVHDVAEVMTEVNNRLCKNNVAEMFVTAWIASLDLVTGEVVWSSAGHNPPYVVEKSGKVTAITGKRSLVLAGMEGIRYKTNSFSLKPGDKIFMFTDGVTEAQNTTGNFFAEARLERTLTDNAVLDVRELCNTVILSVDAFADGAPQADDITVMSVEYRG